MDRKFVIASMLALLSMGLALTGCVTVVEAPAAPPGTQAPVELRRIPFELPIKTAETLAYRLEIGPILLSPDGQQVFHAAHARRTLAGPDPLVPGQTKITQEGRALLYKNGSPVLPVVYQVDDLRLNEEGDYAARFSVVENNKEKWAVVVNGKTQQGEWWQVEEPTLVSWAPAWAHVVKMNPGAQVLPKKYFVTMNNRVITQAYDFMKPAVIFVRDSPRVAFAAMRDLGGPWAIYVSGDSKVTADFEDITPPREQPKTYALVFAAQKDKLWSLYLGERVIASGYDEIKGILLSLDGQRIACRVRQGKSWLVLLDGQVVSPKLGWIRDMVFSPDGSQLVYVAKKRGPGREVEVLMSGMTEMSPRFLYIRQPQFSPDGSRLAYQASSGRQQRGVMPFSKMEFVMVGDQRVTPLFTDSVGFRFLSDRTLVFAGYEAATQSLLHGRIELE